MYQQHLIVVNGFQKIRQLLATRLKLTRLILVPSTKLFAGKHHFSFGVTAEGRVVFRAATDPVIAGEGVSGSSIEGVIAHRDLLPLNLRIPESVRPVIDVVDLYPSARRDLGRSLCRSGQSKNQKLFIISNRRSEEHTSELQSRQYLVCRLLLE